MNEFIDYVLSFYGAEENSVYPELEFTREEVIKAVDVLKGRWPEKFYGDSLDRERVRDIVLETRELDRALGLNV
jgi:hypothetical protein